MAGTGTSTLVSVAPDPAAPSGYRVSWPEGLPQIHTPDYSACLFGTLADCEFTENVVTPLATSPDWKDAATRLNGHFSILLFSKDQQLLRLLHSRSGGCRPYFLTRNQHYYFSDRLEKLLPQAGDAIINAQALCEVLQFRWLTNNVSLLDRVGVLQAGDYLEIGRQQSPEIGSYWQFPIRNALPSGHEELTSLVESQLRKSLTASLAPGTIPAVLLSAGVDSSLLAALMKDLGIEFVAYSHDCENHPNPELATARQFAELLGVEHRVIEVHETEIEDLFRKTTFVLEQPVRAQSDLLLFRLFSEISKQHQQVVYGEAADTLFGTAMVKRYWERIPKRKLFRLPLAPTLGRLAFDPAKIDYIRNLSPVSHHLAEQGLDIEDHTLLHFSKLSSLHYLDHLNDLNVPTGQDAREPELAHLKRINLRGDVSNHFHSACSLGKHFGIQVVSPFVDHSVMETAAGLPLDQYMGKDAVKPILRSIGARYYSAEMMHLPKMGFPAPHDAWIESPLQDLWQDTSEHYEASQIECSNELKWTLMSLYLLQLKWSATLPGR